MQTTSNGEYTIGLRPGRNTVYTVQAGATKSSPVSVKVRPRVRLGRVGAHRYALRVFAATKLAGRVATLQRYDAAHGRWVFVKRVRLHANSTNILPSVISSVAFRSVVPPHARLRALSRRARRPRPSERTARIQSDPDGGQPLRGQGFGAPAGEDTP